MLLEVLHLFNMIHTMSLWRCFYVNFILGRIARNSAKIRPSGFDALDLTIQWILASTKLRLTLDELNPPRGSHSFDVTQPPMEILFTVSSLHICRGEAIGDTLCLGSRRCLNGCSKPPVTTLCRGRCPINS